MSILLLGKNGQVGWALHRALASIGPVIACDRNQANLENLDQLRYLIRHHQPRIVVNAAAYTAVDHAETHVKEARLINAYAPEVLAYEVKRLGGWLVHYSTDYVFDGRKQSSYLESDSINPINVYGQTKYEGEAAIVGSGCQHLILRTSWVFARLGKNFPNTILQAAKKETQLEVVSDQIGAPTSADLIADVTAFCLYRLAHDTKLAQRACGIYHLTAQGQTSWHQYAYFLLEQIQQQGICFSTRAEHVYPISSNRYLRPAMRPANSCLNTDKLREMFDLSLPVWETHVSRMVKEYVLLSSAIKLP